MKPSLILRVAAEYCFLPIWIYSWYLLWVGHNHPGGGFIAGLVGVAALALQLMAWGYARLERWMGWVGPLLVALGLGTAGLTGAFALLAGKPFLTSAVFHLPLPGLEAIELSTAFFFDLGVYGVVLGAASGILAFYGEKDE